MIYTCDKCKSIAVWMYMPSAKYQMRCEEHVPRGCSCNLNEDNVEDTDDQGRLFPCCEWMYNEKGFRVES